MLQTLLDTLSQPWPWYVAGPLIGLFVPGLLLAGNRMFGVSANFRHACAVALPVPSPMAQAEAHYGHEPTVVTGRAPLPVSRDRYARVDPNRFQRTLDEPQTVKGGN